MSRMMISLGIMFMLPKYVDLTVPQTAQYFQAAYAVVAVLCYLATTGLGDAVARAHAGKPDVIVFVPEAPKSPFAALLGGGCVLRAQRCARPLRPQLRP
jgi:hypothetical protein